MVFSQANRPAPAPRVLPVPNQKILSVGPKVSGGRLGGSQANLEAPMARTVKAPAQKAVKVGQKGTAAPKSATVKTAKLPSAKLSTPKPKAVKANPLYDPSQTLSGTALKNAASSFADAQINGPVSELRSQMATNNSNTNSEQQQDFNYYMQLAAAARASVAQGQAAGAALPAQLQATSDQTQQGIQQLGAQATGGAVGRMQALGLDGGQTGQLQAQTAQLGQTGLLNNQTAQNFGAANSANNVAYGANLGATQGLAGTQAIGALGRAGTLANEPINAKIAAEEAQRGALTATALGQLRTQERNYQIAQEGLGVKTAAAQTTAANDAAKNALTASGQKVTAQDNAARVAATLRGQQITQQNNMANQGLREQSLKITQQNDAANQQIRQAAAAAKSGQPVKPLPLASNNLANTKIGEIVSAIQAWQKDGMKNSKGVVQVPHPTDAQMRQVLGGSYDSPLVEAAFDLLGWGALTPGTAQALHNMGVRNTTFRGRPVVVKDQTGAAISGAAKALGL